MDLSEYTSNPIFMTNLVCIVVFALAFPGYFAMMADEDGSSGVDAGATAGDWVVSFNETTDELSETFTMSDNSAEETLFSVNFDDSVNIASVVLRASCNDNDDGPGQGNARDSIMVESDVSGISGSPADQSEQTDCGGGGQGTIILSWDLIPGYTGESYVAEDQSMNDIRAEWSDNGSGRGDWMATINMDVASGVNPLFQDNSEDVDITWTVVYYQVEFEAVVEE